MKTDLQFLGRVDNRPSASPSLFFSYSPNPESVRELQRIFPNIPKAYIVRELDHAGGSVTTAIDALLQIYPDFVPTASARQSISPSFDSTTSLPINSFSVDEPVDESLASQKLSRRDWDSVDTQTRKLILLERKKLMISKAREQFRKSQDGQNNE